MGLVVLEGPFGPILCTQPPCSGCKGRTERGSSPPGGRPASPWGAPREARGLPPRLPPSLPRSPQVRPGRGGSPHSPPVAALAGLQREVDVSAAREGQQHLGDVELGGGGEALEDEQEQQEQRERQRPGRGGGHAPPRGAAAAGGERERAAGSRGRRDVSGGAGPGAEGPGPKGSGRAPRGRSGPALPGGSRAVRAPCARLCQTLATPKASASRLPSESETGRRAPDFIFRLSLFLNVWIM